MHKNIGTSDHPILDVRKDRLSLSMQVKGLANFIEHCETPMSVSIQGTWGTGKTSFVNMVESQILNNGEEEIRDDIVFIHFNSWKFIQFDMSEQLSSSLIIAITKELSKELTDESGKASVANIFNGMEILKRTGKLGMIVANEVIKEKLDVDVMETLNRAGLDDTDKMLKKTAETVTAIDTINELKKNLQEVIDNRLGLNQKNAQDLPAERLKRKRVVIFVDDLDRLPPDKAVEVLEILNMFLDCRHCVFLLAIDYNVVVNGVTLKYKNTIAEDKGHEFFEKMVQVVYTLPERMNNTDRYISEILSNNGRNIALAYEFANLVKCCGKDNPRAVKRLMNSYILLEMMRDGISGATSDPADSVILFALLCLQHNQPEFYNDLSTQFDGLYNYEKGVNWFNTLHKFCYEYVTAGRSEVTIEQEKLRKWKWVTRELVVDGRPEVRLDRTRLTFVSHFLEALYRGKAFMRAVPGSMLNIRCILDLQYAIQWTNLLWDGDTGRSRLDNVTQIEIKTLVGNRPFFTRYGTAVEAYQLTIRQILVCMLEQDGATKDIRFLNLQDEQAIANAMAEVVQGNGEEVLKKAAALFHYFLSLEEQPAPEWVELPVMDRSVWLRVQFADIPEEDYTDLLILLAKLVSNFARIGFTWYRDLRCREVMAEGYRQKECITADSVCFAAIGRDIWAIKDRDPRYAYLTTLERLLGSLSDDERDAVIMRFSDRLENDKVRGGSEDAVDQALEDTVGQSSPEDMFGRFSEDVFSWDGDELFSDSDEDHSDADADPADSSEAPASGENMKSRFQSYGDDLDRDNPWEFETESERMQRENSIIEEQAFDMVLQTQVQDGWCEWPIIDEHDGGQINLQVYIDLTPDQCTETIYKIAEAVSKTVVWYRDPNLRDGIRLGYRSEHPLLKRLSERELSDVWKEMPALFRDPPVVFSEF